MQGKLRNMTTIYLFREDKVLMLYRIGSRVVLQPSWCGIGGHFEKEELNDARACVLREMQEEIGLTEKDLETVSLRYVTLRHKNDEIRQIYYFFAQLKKEAQVAEQCSEGILKWVDVDEVLALPMPHTARYVMQHYLETGKDTETVYGGIAQPDGVLFTELAVFP